MQLRAESSLSAGAKARLQILRRSMCVPAAGTHGPPPPSPWLEIAKAPSRLGRCWPAQGWRMATRQPRRRLPRGRWAVQQMLQLLEDAPIQPPAEPRYRCRRRRLWAWHRFSARSRAHNRLTLQVQRYSSSGGPRTADHVMAPPLTRPGKPRGSATWRKWLPEHISRAAFSAPTASGRAVTGVLGGGARQTVTTC